MGAVSTSYTDMIMGLHRLAVQTNERLEKEAIKMKAVNTHLVAALKAIADLGDNEASRIAREVLKEAKVT